MANRVLTGALFKKMVINGAMNLKNCYKEIDDLNVFPIPDGDTGTNMQMTIMSGIKELEISKSDSIIEVSGIFSSALIRGSRGNSGAILSQFFKGLSNEIKKVEDKKITTTEFVQALVGGYEKTYNSVMEPVEGTILTVVREAAERVVREQSKLETIEDILAVYIKQARLTLSKTPELLPVLKEAGVVDSGGAGFVKIVEGMIMALEGDVIVANTIEEIKHDDDHSAILALGEIDIKYGYCTEFIVTCTEPEKVDVNEIRNFLSQFGDSLVVINDDEILKVHVHTDRPGDVFNYAQTYGELDQLKVENMRRQNREARAAATKEGQESFDLKPNKGKTKYGIVAVCQGSGIKKIFTELGADYIIDGGQTMNPSTQDFIDAVKNINAEHIIILPNNSNVILSAEQACTLITDKVVKVVKCKNIAQGYSSILNFDAALELDENLEIMSEASKASGCGEVTYSVRDTSINGVEIRKDDFLAICKGDIIASVLTEYEASCSLCKALITDSSEIITIFYGKDSDEEKANAIKDYCKTINSTIEVEIIEGNQDIYSIIINVE